MTSYYLKVGFISNIDPKNNRGDIRRPYIFTEKDIPGNAEQRKRWLDAKVRDGIIGILPSSIEAINSTTLLQELGELGYSPAMIYGHLQTGQTGSGQAQAPARAAVEDGGGQAALPFEPDVPMIPNAGDMNRDSLIEHIRVADPSIDPVVLTGLDKDQLISIADVLKGPSSAAALVQERVSSGRGKM